MIGTTIRHYRVEKKLGEGGMGVVYKARDLRLGRHVALKFLTPRMIQDNAVRERFIREAQTAAVLDHPNICTIFEVAEAEDLSFISMAYIKGQSLKERLSQGPLSIDEVKDIVLQIAEGLRAAHEKGIIHRDIKPANIMLTQEGRVKIMDFGLAKFDQDAEITRTKGILGTLAYMSPEQAVGDRVDRTTDIWSFGVTLYELLTGEHPFGKAHEPSLIHAILNEPPGSIRLLRPDLPQAIEEIVRKALKKDRAFRYQSMDEILIDLKTIPVWEEESPETKRSILVLPFDNLSPERDQDYFCDGITEEIITELSHIQDLLVISRVSAMTFKGTQKKIRQIAREANVRYVLEGSVRKAGNRLRITAQLIEAENDSHLWAERFDGVLEDVFEIQESVSRKIVEALKGRLSQEDRKRLSARPSFQDVGIYEAYVRARYEFWKSEPDSTQKALRFLEEAIDKFGEHPLLISGVGAVHWQLYHFRGVLDQYHLDRIKECVEKLFTDDPDSAQGHRLSSYLSLHKGDTKDAIKHLQQAMNEDPNDTETLLWLSFLLAINAGKPEKARPLAERWLRIDPLHPLAKMNLSISRWMSGDIENALQGFEEWHRQEPDNRITAFYLGHLYVWTGRSEDSLCIAEGMFRQDPDEGMGQTLRFLALAFNGKREAAVSSMSPPVKEWAWMDFHLPWLIAEGYAVLDEREKALKWLERSVEKGNFNFPLLNEIDPLLSNIRGEARFQKLMQRVRKEWETYLI